MTATSARLWHASLRLRLTVAGTALAAMSFTIVGAIVIILYHQSLTDSVRHTVAHTAAEVAAQITSEGKLPDPIPMPVDPGVPRVQVLDSRNHVITGDPASAGQPAIFRLAPGLSRQQAVVHRLSQLDASSAAWSPTALAGTFPTASTSALVTWPGCSSSAMSHSSAGW